MRILIVGHAFHYGDAFDGKHDVRCSNDPSCIETCNPDVMVFTGGEDVTPYLYGEVKHPATGNCTVRDAKEQAFFDEGQRLGIKMVGICRGSQFLTVMNGGKLVQHIFGHGIAGTHKLSKLVYGTVVEITSTHHQCMYPYNLPSKKYDVIAWGEEHGMEGMPEGQQELDYIPEVVWYHETQCLCVQGHPEFMAKESTGYQYFQSLINNYIFAEVQDG